MSLLSTLSDTPSSFSFSQQRRHHQSRINRFSPNSLLSVKTTTTTKPLAQATAIRHSYDLKEGQKRHFHSLPSGLKMEVIEQEPPAHVKGTWKDAPPVVLVHGSFHAAWCWAEYWMPFFSSSGLHCYAISLLGQGESDVPQGAAAGTLETHANDIADFIKQEISAPPVLIGHSFGGLIIQSYLSTTINATFGATYPKPAGAVLVCSVPPSGNSGLVWRYLLTKPIAAVKVTVSLAAKAFANSLSLCRETFFSPEMEDHLVLRYQELMKGSLKIPLFDLKKLNASLPVPSIQKGSVEILVLGANSDFIVDMEGLYETAKFYDVEPLCVEGVAHDMMLDSAWDKGAQIILEWIRNLPANHNS
ncbi:Alpha/beta-Hydrolases superfamily protein [Rhynchospora pubera]|uniref:Alpha/beta-Hydrolases superfamily protein n=1 Tax=Rhynchospora pubera TaxID=906938 RepID=A0AAV8EJY4_9POAL|nr:Alpha/beta-Hydrolases superfamily protein [Rhynchospora pubera]